MAALFELSGSDWTVNDQRCLDEAIASTPKVDGEESKARWQRISGKVPGRSLKECVSRYREIRAKLQQQHQALNIVSSSQPLHPQIPPSEEIKVKPNQGVSVGYSPPVAAVGLNRPVFPPKHQMEQSSSKSKNKEKYSKPQPTPIPTAGGGGGCGGGVLIDDDLGEEVSRFSSMNLKEVRNGGGWWRKLDEDDPISLEPLRELPYPPFELTFQTSTSLIKPAANYFDGKVLAYYIVSTANFANPLSRDPLSREDCRRLDEYLSRYKLEAVLVTEAYDLFQSAQQRGGSSGREIQLQREATVLFRSLFSFIPNATTTTPPPASITSLSSPPLTASTAASTASHSSSSPPLSSNNGNNGRINNGNNSSNHQLKVQRVMNAAKGFAGNVLSVDDIVRNNPLYGSLYGNVYKSNGDEVDISLYAELFPSLPSKSKNNRNRGKKKSTNSNSGGGDKEKLIGFLGAGKQNNILEQQISQAKKRSSKRNGELQGQKNGSRKGNSSFANAVENKNMQSGMSEALRLRMEEQQERKGQTKTMSWAGKASK